MARSIAEEMAELYPGVDVTTELRKMRAWSLSNRAKRKTARGILRFINSWLSRQQDSALRTPHGSRQKPSPSHDYGLSRIEDLRRRRDAGEISFDRCEFYKLPSGQIVGRLVDAGAPSVPAEYAELVRSNRP